MLIKPFLFRLKNLATSILISAYNLKISLIRKKTKVTPITLSRDQFRSTNSRDRFIVISIRTALCRVPRSAAPPASNFSFDFSLSSTKVKVIGFYPKYRPPMWTSSTRWTSHVKASLNLHFIGIILRSYPFITGD